MQNTGRQPGVVTKPPTLWQWLVREVLFAPAILIVFCSSLFGVIWWAKSQQDHLDMVEVQFHDFEGETRRNIEQINTSLSIQSTTLAGLAPQITGIHDLLQEMDKRWDYRVGDENGRSPVPIRRTK
jgi:hypothetical protein